MESFWPSQDTTTEADFLDFFQKQFAAPNDPLSSFPPFMPDGVNPQNLSLVNLTPSPTSEDSSPSPPTFNQDDSAPDDPSLKRKASDHRLDDEPHNKSQHTTSPDKTGLTLASRRRSSGQTGKDEQRLLRRKEQNRAAQRAFRERKEKHVKDLEDKVAELEAKNDATQHENDNLRDIVNRLQSENMNLKQSAFTFSVPKESTNPPDSNVFSPVSPTRSMSSPSAVVPLSPKPSNPLSWSSLTTFDPNVLNLLDDNVSQATATDSAMRMDFGFGNSEFPTTTPLTVIANNPMFTTPAFEFPGETHVVGSGPPFNSNDATAFNFDMNALTSWTPAATQPNASASDPLFDDLFRGYLNSLAPPDLMSLTASTPSISPIAHHTSPSRISTASSSSPSILGQEALFSKEPSSSATDTDISVTHTPETSLPPKTRVECQKKIANDGDSMFAPPIQKNQDLLGPMITCAGSSLPRTEQNDNNIEVFAAWKSISSDPKFKDIDVTELCRQFTEKACCDGTKVVLEPSAVTEIMDNLSKSQNQ